MVEGMEENAMRLDIYMITKIKQNGVEVWNESTWLLNRIKRLPRSTQVEILKEMKRRMK
jgi:hypothetical protein